MVQTIEHGSTDSETLAITPWGDAGTFWHFWEQNRQKQLARQCLWWMDGNHAEADDALSEACLHAFQSWTQHPRPIINVAGWCTRLVQNQCRTQHRVQARRTRVVQCVEDLPTWSDAAVDAAGASPEDLTLTQELGQHIRRALDQLPPRLQAVAQLYFVHEQPYAAIATQLHLTQVNVRKRIQHARALLQAYMKAYLETGSVETTPSHCRARRGTTPTPVLQRDEHGGGICGETAV